MSKEISKAQLYYSAVGFYRAGLDYALKMNPKMGNDIFIVSPVCTVNLSFSAELFLKLLYFISTGAKEFYGHKLEEIYPQLPDKIRQKIEEKYLKMEVEDEESLHIIKLSINTEKGNPADQKTKYKMENLSVKELLEIHNESFIKWRYSFESPNHYVSHDYNIKLMCKFILSLKSVCDDMINNVKNISIEKQ